MHPRGTVTQTQSLQQAQEPMGVTASHTSLPSSLCSFLPPSFQTHPKLLGLKVKAPTSLCSPSSKHTANSFVALSSSDVLPFCPPLLHLPKSHPHPARLYLTCTP